MNARFAGATTAAASPLARLDPRLKLPMTMALIAGITLAPERAWAAYVLLWGLLAVLAGRAALTPWRLARLAALAFPFTLAAAGLIFTTPGAPFFVFGGFAATVEGLGRFASIALRSWLAVQAALLLTLTTPLPDLLDAARWLRVPETLVAVTGFMLRYLVLLSDEAQQLQRARAARSGALPDYRPGGRLLWRARVAGGMVGNLFLRAYERSERVYAAMLARGYGAPVVSRRAPPPARTDLVEAALPVLAVVLIDLTAFFWTRA